MQYLKENLDLIQDKIKNTCIKINRDPRDIKIIAVTKTVETDIINNAISYGVSAIGENRVQEITRKFDDIHSTVEWHLIGHLQRNKVKYIIDKVDMIHSVDSLKLAEEINLRAKSIDKIMPVLIQVNVSKEDSKFGVDVEDVSGLLAKMTEYKNLNIQGLMTIAPFYDNPEDVRIYFKELKKLFDELGKSTYENISMKYLSMGMTNDYEVAIEEGANMVRIGTGLFGQRDYI